MQEVLVQEVHVEDRLVQAMCLCKGSLCKRHVREVLV